MTLQYVISGGHLYLDKRVLSSELLLPQSPLKRILNSTEDDKKKQPKIAKVEDMVTIDFNNSSDVILDEGFYELFKKLKSKYKGRIKGKIVIRITALTSYHVVLNLNSEDDKVVYES